MGDSNAQDGPNGIRHDCWAKGLKIINAFFLVEPFGYKLCLVLINGADKFILNPKYPFTPNNSTVSKKRNKRPSVVGK